MWSHKPGTKGVTNDSNRVNVKLCDENINEYTSKNFCNKDDVRYYRITKDTNIYNSWIGNGHNTESTGTPYRP